MAVMCELHERAQGLVEYGLIIALVASLAVTIMPGTGRGRLKALTLEIAALLRRERLGARPGGSGAPAAPLVVPGDLRHL